MNQTLLSAVLVLAASASAFADDVAVIVGFHGDADPGVFAKHGGKAALDLGAVRAASGRIPAGQLKALRNEPGVAYVEEDLVRHATLVVPNDTHYAKYQADDMDLIRAPQAWDLSTVAGAGARVAVLDTGCQTNHADLSGKVKSQRNFTGGKAGDVSDKHGHGTHTAGTVGAKTNNGTGVAGVGYACELAIGKVLGNNGSGYSSWIINGINWAHAGGGAKIISLSLGSSTSSKAEQDAVDAAVAAGAVVIAAAGNDGSDALNYPAAYEAAIAVAAVDAKGARASFSNFGGWVDIAAPGVDIASTYKNGGYALMSGTSMATPHVAGVAALVRSRHPNIASADLRTKLVGTQSTLGVVDAYAAVQ